jgi:hypothetical protein
MAAMNKRAQAVYKSVLPLPLLPEVSPVESYKLHGDNSMVYCLHVPKTALDASASTLAEGRTRGLYNSFCELLGLLATIQFTNMKSDDGSDDEEGDKKKRKGDGAEEPAGPLYFEVGGVKHPVQETYMEYLADKDKSVYQGVPSLDSCVGIRFHFVVQAPLELSTAPCVLSAAVEHRIKENANRTKGKGKKAKPEDIRAHERWREVTSMGRYFNVLKEYLNSYSVGADVGPESIRRHDSPFHPQNCFSIETATPPGTHPSQLYRDPTETDGVTFAFPNYVFRLPHSFVAPLTLFALTLPGTGEWSHERGDDLKATVDGLSRTYVLEYVHNLNRDRTFGWRRITDSFDTEKIVVEADTEMAAAEKAVRLREVSMRHVDRIRSCFAREDVDMGGDLNKIGAFANTFDKFDKIKPIPPVDDTIPYLGNYMVHMSNMFEYGYKLVSTARLLFMVHLAYLDGLVDEHKLHFNLFLAGEGESGKSYVLQCCLRMMIPNTIENDTNFTENSLTGCDHRVFTSLFCDEAPPIMLGAEYGNRGKGDDEGNPVVKMAMDSCYTTRKTAFVDDGGVRSATNHRTELVHSWVVASNHPVSSIPHPMRSRFVVVDVVQTRKDYNTREDKQEQTDDERFRVMEKRLLEFEQETHQVTLGVVYVNMLIRVGALRPPNLTGARYLIKAFFDHVGKTKNSDEGTRTKNQFKRALSAAVTFHAVRRYLEFYGTPQGPPSLDNDISIFCPRWGPQGQLVHPGIQPFLVATESLTVAVISAFIEYILTYDYFVLEAYINRIIITNKDNCVSPDNPRMNMAVSEDGMFKYDTSNINTLEQAQQVVTNYLRSQGMIVSKHQVSTAYENLHAAGVLEFNAGEVKLAWKKVKDVFTFDEATKRYKYMSELNAHLEKVVKTCIHEDFARRRRVLTFLPVDRNHQNILDEIRVPFPSNKKYKARKPAPIFDMMSRTGLVTLVEDKGSNVSPELQALKTFLPDATPQDVDLYLHDYPSCYNELLVEAKARREEHGISYPEDILEGFYAAYDQDKYANAPARKKALSLIDRKRKRVEEPHPNPAEEEADTSPSPAKRANKSDKTQII